MQTSRDGDGRYRPAGVEVWHAFLLRKAGQEVTRLAEASLGGLGLTLRHFGVLSVIVAEPGQSQRAIGARLRIDRTTIVELVDELERSGLLERRNGVDRRTYSLYATTTGIGRLEDARRVMARVHEDFLRPLTGVEREELHALLMRLVLAE